MKIISEAGIKYPHIKFFGLLYIWFWLAKHIELIKKSDIVHCHDVFIWYLPFRFLFPNKKVYTTFHGGQDIWPIPFKNKLYVQLAARLSRGTIAIGDFIGKYYGIMPDFVSYGGVDSSFGRGNTKKQKIVVFLGRLEKQTGVYEFIKRIKKLKGYKVYFLGDGSLKKVCEKHGTVRGFVDPAPFLRKAEICFAGGYLAALEALSCKCKLWYGWNTPIKKDYWQLSPFHETDYKWARSQTWDKVADLYLKLWRK